MSESLPRIIDQEHFEITFYGCDRALSQSEIFETIAKHIRNTGDIVETIILSTDSAIVVFHTNDISRLPMASMKP